MFEKLINTFNGWIGRGKITAGSITARVDDAPGWAGLTTRPHENDPAVIQDIYQDALTAWRKNPLAWRIIAITTDYVIGERIVLSSPRREVQRFIDRFWNHSKNLLDLRLETMCDELSRAGDLFILLFRNPADGMSYLRFVTKDRILRIETAANDWETELVYYERDELAGERAWLSPNHPQAGDSEAVMLHYAINRPLGALLGESDLVTLLPWLQRYTRLLEDRVRLNWAVRAFLWVVTVPSSRVREKAEQYRAAPEAGSVIVKDESEDWKPVTPLLHATDSQSDLKAVRQMIDAGSGYPPHWRGEPHDTNLATALAMQAPTEKHLARRQKYFIFMLKDLLYQAYCRAAQAGKARQLPDANLAMLFQVSAPEITKDDNERLANAANQVSLAIEGLGRGLSGARSGTLARAALRMVFKFAGEELSGEEQELIVKELGL